MIQAKPQPTVLLVEDHRDLAQTVTMALETANYSVDYASDGALGLHLASTEIFDAIILDVMLPGQDGFTVCKRLREEFGVDTPVLMLTARDQLEDKLTGFKQGADDYLVKPFEMAELLARVDAMIKRHRGDMGAGRWNVGDLTLDINTMQASRQDQEIELSPTGFKILKILMRESPKVVSRDAMEHELWGDSTPDSDSLRSHVYTLRKAVDKPFDRPMIKTVKGVGLKIS
ncbi:MAG: response regulator transcription factor [Pseudomonadota bacterium]